MMDPGYHPRISKEIRTPMTARSQFQDRGIEQREMSMFDLLNALLLHRRLVIALPLLFFAVAVVYSLTRERTWTSDASFMPQEGSGNAALSGLAAQFGVPISRAGAGETPAFYAELIHSRAILDAALDSTFTFVREGRQRTLPLSEIMSPRAEGGSRERALLTLRNAVGVSTARETGLIRISVTTEHPQLSERVAALLLDLVNEFNTEKRQVQAASERRFVQERLAQARNELAETESEFQSFEERNRRIESPQLVLARGRLQHELSLRQHLVTSLAEAFEQARIEEVRNLPLITIIDRPAVAERPNGRGTLFRSLFALAFGFAIAAAYALVQSALQTQSASRPDAELFRQLRQETFRPFRRLVGTVRPQRQGTAGNGDARVPARDDEVTSSQSGQG
jgi:tyrosine-protein kinase Etk/Wzc